MVGSERVGFDPVRPGHVLDGGQSQGSIAGSFHLGGDLGGRGLGERWRGYVEGLESPSLVCVVMLVSRKR